MHVALTGLSLQNKIDMTAKKTSKCSFEQLFNRWEDYPTWRDNMLIMRPGHEFDGFKAEVKSIVEKQIFFATTKDLIAAKNFPMQERMILEQYLNEFSTLLHQV